MTKALRILLSNDDGYSSVGIKRLYEALISRHDVTVAAPQNEQSGIGHAFTFNKPICFAKLPETMGMNGYMVAGTPSDCVKFAISRLLNEKPDVVVSGVNSGENSGISGFYSGTLAAAREGAFWRIPSFAFSLCAGGEDFLVDYCSVSAGHYRQESWPSRFLVKERIKFTSTSTFPHVRRPMARDLKSRSRAWRFLTIIINPLPVIMIKTAISYTEKKKTSRVQTTMIPAPLLNKYTTITPLHFDATAHWQLKRLSCLEQ